MIIEKKSIKQLNKAFFVCLTADWSPVPLNSKIKAKSDLFSQVEGKRCQTI
jgi:hypothetical protein